MTTKDRILLLFTQMICVSILVVVVCSVISSLYYGRPLLSSEGVSKIEAIISGIIGFISGATRSDQHTPGGRGDP